MKNKLIAAVEESGIKKEVAEFDIGDSVDVHLEILEGEKKRTQVFSGLVIARKGDGTANLGTTTVTKHNTEVPSGGQSEQNKWPGGVSKFDPINLTPGPKHPSDGKFDHSADEGV